MRLSGLISHRTILSVPESDRIVFQSPFSAGRWAATRHLRIRGGSDDQTRNAISGSF